MVRPPRRYVKMGLAPPPPPRRLRTAALGLAALAIAVTTGLMSWQALGSSAARFRRPAPVDASRLTTRWPIKHVVFIVKENRSFDSMFGLFPGADGTTTGKVGTETVPLTRGTDGAIPKGIYHSYQRAVADWDQGKMDGFAYDAHSRHWAYTLLHPKQVAQYWQWAKH